jgi:hypothetical protein
MVTIRFQRRVDENGLLTIHVPRILRDLDLEVLVVLQPLTSSESDPEDSADEHGWPKGFFKETYGSLAADPLERLPQGDIEERGVIW